MCSTACLVRSPLFLKDLLQFGYTQGWDAWRRCTTECVCSWLWKANEAPQLQWNLSSLCWYLCRTRLVGLLKALLHSSQYRIPCFCWWCTVSKWALSRTSLHSLHPYFRCRLVFLRVKECVAKVPFPFGRLSSILETLMGAVDTRVAFSSCESVGLSVSKGGSRTAGIPVELSCAPTLDALRLSAGGLLLVLLHLGFLSAPLEGVSSL